MCAGKKVGVAAYDPSIPFYTTFWPNFEKQAATCGESFTISNSKGDSLTSRNQAEQIIAQGYDGLILDFADPQGWEDIVAKAKAQGMCVLNTAGAPITGAINVPLNQLPMGVGVGEYAAEWINKNLGGQANVAMLVRPDNPAVHERDIGFKDTVTKLVPGAKFVGEAKAIGTQEATKAAANLLQAHPEINVMWTNGDGEAIAAAASFRDAGKTDPTKFFIAGTNGEQANLDLIAAGDNPIQATFSPLFPVQAAANEMDMERCLLGQPYAPTQKMTGQLVTKENVAQINQWLLNPFDPAVLAILPQFREASQEQLTTPQ